MAVLMGSSSFVIQLAAMQARRKPTTNGEREEQQPVLIAAWSRVAAFASGGRLWLLCAVFVLGAGFVEAAFRLNDNYWTSIFLEAGAGAGVLALVQLLTGAIATRLERGIVFVVAVALLALAYRSEGFSRALLIELGAGVGLFLALDLYLARVLHDMERKETAAAGLIHLAIAFQNEIASWEPRQASTMFEEPSVIPDGPSPVYMGTEPESDVRRLDSLKQPLLADLAGQSGVTIGWRDTPGLTDLPQLFERYSKQATIQPNELRQYGALATNYLSSIDRRSSRTWAPSIWLGRETNEAERQAVIDFGENVKLFEDELFKDVPAFPEGCIKIGEDERPPVTDLGENVQLFKDAPNFPDPVPVPPAQPVAFTRPCPCGSERPFMACHWLYKAPTSGGDR